MKLTELYRLCGAGACYALDEAEIVRVACTAFVIQYCQHMTHNLALHELLSLHKLVQVHSVPRLTFSSCMSFLLFNNQGESQLYKS